MLLLGADALFSRWIKRPSGRLPRALDVRRPARSSRRLREGPSLPPAAWRQRRPRVFGQRLAQPRCLHEDVLWCVIERAGAMSPDLTHSLSVIPDAGIYTMIDLGLPLNGSINRATPVWQTNLLDLYTTTIQAFNKYDNVSLEEMMAWAAREACVAMPRQRATDTTSLRSSSSLHRPLLSLLPSGPCLWCWQRSGNASCKHECRSVHQGRCEGHQGVP